GGCVRQKHFFGVNKTNAIICERRMSTEQEQ
ncbi:MAG: hypothetical protein ACI90V_006095, partial [Bacillariaceae sp.]